MGEIKEIKKVENDSLTTMQKNVKEGYDKFNDGRGGKKYSDELRSGCQQVINQIDSKVNKGFSQLNGPKSKLSKDYRAKRDIFAKKSKNIRESIKKCCDSWTNVKRVHKDRLNNLAGWIDNYENDVVKIINDLIDQQNEMLGIIKKEQSTGKNYFDIKDGVYTLTKDTNLPKIHEVFDGVVKPGEKWMIDYSECKNATIKNRMLSTMGGYRCYLHCDKKKGTYFVSTSEIKPNENDGNKMMGISTQRALIREGVKIVPNSKITRDAKAAIEANAKKEANKGLTNDEKSDLKTTMPKKLREKLSEKPGLRDEFFTKTEYDLKNIILRAKSAGYKYTGEVCSRNGYTKNGRILEIHLIQGSTEVDWPLLTSKFSNPLFNRLDDREGDLVSYMKNRIKQLRGKLSYADKHETVIQGQRQTEKTTAKEIEDSKKLKENALYGLGLVGTLIDNLIEKKGNTWMTNDDQILSKCKTYVEDAIYSIENADIITKDNLTQIQNTLTDNIRPFYLNQLSFGISGLTKKEQVSKQLSNIISGPKAKAIKGVRKLGEWTTVFDNEETSFLRDEIIDNMDVKNATINETWANNCFKNIQKFLVGDDDIDRSRGEVKSGKKALIDGLYSAAGEDGTGEKLLKYMQDKGIMSKTVTFRNKKIKELSKNLASFLRRKDKNVKETLEGISTESVKQGLIQKKTQLEASNNLSEEQIRELNYYNYAIYEMPSDEFEEIVKEEKIKLSILRYQGVDDVLRSNLTPWLVKEGKGMKGIDNEDILNDSLGTGGIFDRSDENCAKIGPIIKEIIEEVVILAVSMILSPIGAGEGLYVSFRVAKAAAKGLKGIAKLIKFLQKFAGAFAKLTARQFASKFSVRAAKSVKTVKTASRVVKGAEEVRGLKKIKYAWNYIKANETFGSLCGKMAMKGTSLMIEGAAFHLNSTLIHNAIQGKRLGDGLNPFDYTEGPDGEKIPNRKSYAQSIAFLGILKTLGKSIQSVTGKWIEGISKGKYELNIAQKFLSNALSIGGEMGSMMVTDQILSITFDHKLKAITGEDLIMMFGMIAGLRLNGKFEMKIQEYDKKSVTFEMKQGENTFNVKIDGQGNVLKVEGVDGSGRKFAHPEKELGIKSKVDGENLRTTRAGQEVGTVKGNIRELGNLHEGDVITVKHGEKDVRLKKNDKGNWEIEDAGGIENDRFRPGEEFVVKENSDRSGYHLEPKVGSGPKISLDGSVRVKLKGGESSGSGNRGRSNDVNPGLPGGEGQRDPGNQREPGNQRGPEGERQGQGQGQGQGERQGQGQGERQYKAENITGEERRIAEEKLYEKFDKGIMSENGIKIDGTTYKLKREPYEGKNLQHKGRVVYTEIGPEGRVYRIEANSNTFSLPENSNGNRIRDRFNSARKKYIDQNLDATIRSNRQEVIEGLSRKIESKTGDLEQKRQDKVTLEGKKKTLSNEIDGLKSRKAKLEGQLKSIPREITIQPENVSLNDIYKVFFEGAGKTVSIGGKKCNFIKVEGNKIIFDKCEFGSFKDLKDAGIKFDIDIKKKQQRNRTDKTYERQQKLFDELVEAEAKMSKSNEIITKYENLQQKKAQVESEIKTNKFFADKAQELASKHVHVWIEGVEYQCTDLKINNGRTTLEFKQSDGSDHFTISSFEQLKNKGQVNGFGDRSNVRDKSSRAAGRDLTRAERENHELFWGENGNPNKPGLFREEVNKLNEKRQELQLIDQQLQSGKSEYDNAKLATSPKKVPNPEYERVQNEIEGIKNQLIGKESDLNALNQKLGTSANEISALETEISGLKAEKDRLTNNQEAERIEEREREQREEREREQREQREREQREQREREQREREAEAKRKAAEDAKKAAEARRQRQRVKDSKKEQERFEDIPEVEILGTEIQEFELNMLRNLRKGRNEKIYLNEFGEPKNVLPLGNGENLYVSNCLEYRGRKYIVGYVQKGGELELRLFYRSNSEGARRSCPGERAPKRDKNGNIVSGGGYSKGEGITNSSYETTTRVINELQYKFDRLPTETAHSDPISIKGKGVGYNILEPAMQSEIKVDKLFNGQYGQYNNTVDYIKEHTVAEVKDMYRRLGVGIDTSGMKIVEGKGYTYEHQYLGTIEVKVCRLNYNGKDLDFSFSKVKNDPQNRVRIEEVNYADAKVSSFGIYDKQINAAPLTGKPIDYANERHWQVPKDQNGTRYGGTYMDIRDLYQENPFIKKFKEISQKDQGNPQDLRQRQEEANARAKAQAEEARQQQVGPERQSNERPGQGVNTVGREISLDGNNLKNIISIDANGNVNFNHEYVTSNTVEIEGQKYKIFEEGKGDGIGCMVREGKSIQIGNFVNGKLEGKGIQIHGNGNKYEGNFVNGEFEGKGTYTWASGEKYEGEFKNGEYEGEGKIYNTNGNLRYEGEFKNGSCEGKGKRYDTNGNLRYEGEFKNGKYEGKGKEYSTNGDLIYEGEFKNGKYEGKGTYTFASGDKYEGEFMGGQLRNGIEISNNGGIKKVKFVGDVTRDQMNELATHIKPGETAEIELVSGEKVTIKNIEGKFEEWLGNSGEVEFSLPIEGKLGKYLEKRIYNEHNSSEIQPEIDQRERDQRQLEPKMQSNERPERGVNTEIREMSEVHRNSDVVAIGDLHGQYIALKGNMEFAGLAREVNGHLEWTGGNKKVVFQGDILADRGTDGLRIIKEIHNLREQARKQGGDIDIIVGNHDDFMISYLTGRNGVHGNGIDISIGEGFGNQGLGITELLKFYKGGGNSQIDALKQGRKNILQNMRNSPEGKMILEEICNMKLVSQVDDVLYCHTNPTAKMLEYLTIGNVQENINLINQKYQGFLRKALLGEGNSTITIDEFNEISDIFLHTNNRPMYGSEIGLENYCRTLNNQGINMISHGHSGGAGRAIESSGVRIVDIDYSYGKGGGNEGQHSVSIVKKEGGVNYIGDNVAYANLEYPIGTEVYVTRSNGGESIAKVDSYNPTTKKYRVVFEEGGKIRYKDVTSESLRNKSGEQDRIQREQQNRNQREQQDRNQREQQDRNQRTQQEIINNNKGAYTENVNFTENVDVDYSKWNMSKEVKEYLDDPKTMKPRNKIELDGQEIYITDLINVGGNPGFLGFAKRNGTYSMNYYIKSNSEGLWRCLPGNFDAGGSKAKMDEFNDYKYGKDPEIKQLLKSFGFNFTKNFSYERTTMVDFRIQEIFDKKYLTQWPHYYDKITTIYSLYGKGNIEGGIEGKSKEKLQRFIDMSQEINVLDDLTPKDPDGNFVKQNQYDIADVKEFYAEQTFGIDISSLLLEPQKTYKYNHFYLGDVNVKVVQGKMNGKDVEIFFSSTKAEPDLVWIDQIQYKNQEINSYGLLKNQINGGWLTAKPIEYSGQTPIGYRENYKGKTYGSNYIDIRPIYQESPIIKKYKKLSQQQYRTAA